MSSLLPLNDGEYSLIVRHSIDSEEEMIEAVVDAFLAAGVDVDDRNSTLAEWIDPDIFETLQWSPGRPLYLCTQIWDHLVVMTPEEVRIYVSSGDLQSPTHPSGQQTSSNGSATRDSAIIETTR